jgi:hypothetical protein
MKKKNNLLARAAMMLLLAVLSSVGAWAATDVVTIGSAQWNLASLPLNTNWKYFVSQQIYTNTEVGTAKKISAIAFNTTNGPVTRNIDIYMTHITKSAFENGNDLVPVSTTDLVFSGNVTFAAGQWNTIEFDKLFAYNGTQNLLITIKDNTGIATGYGDLKNYTFDASMQGITAYSDGSDINPTNMVLGDASSSYSNSKSQIKIFSTNYPTPYKLAVAGVTDNSVQIQCSLRGDATSWNLQYRKVGTSVWTTVNNITTRSKTIEGLTTATQYEAQVQSVFDGGNKSDWTNSITFTTSCCPVESQVDLLYKLNSWNGWKNFAVQIVDAETGIEMALLRSPTSGLAEGTITLCCGRTYNVNWIYDEDQSDYYDQLTFSLLFQPGDEFYTMDYGEAPQESKKLTEFVMDCGDYCAPMPRNLEVDDVFFNGATLSFTSFTPAGKIAYSTEADFNPATATNVQNITFDAAGHGVSEGSANGSEVSYSLSGLDPQTDYYVAIQSICTALPYDGGGHSRWTKPVKITTGPEEAPVENITVVNDGPAKTQVGWTPKGKETKHNVYIRQQTGKGTPVDASQIQMFNLIKEDGATYENWGGGQYASRATSGETSKWFVVTKVPANAVVKATTDEADTKTKMTNKKGVTTEMFSSGAEKQENDGSDVEALRDEIKTKITNLKKVRDDGKSLSKSQWKTKYSQYKKALSDWYNAEEGSAEEKALDEQVKSLKRELGLDKRKVKKALKHSTNSGYKAYKKARKSKKNRAGDLEEYFVWFNHEDGVGYFGISELEIVTEENWGDWTSYTDVTDNSYAFDNLKPGTTYEVMIEPVYDDGTTGTETTFMFTTLGEETDPIEKVFSVSEGKKVQFAHGNLQHLGDSYEGVWSLAKQQYEMIGESNIVAYGERTYPASYSDLFCWSTSSTSNGLYNYYDSEENEQTWSYFQGELADWGANPDVISNIGAGWSTLNKEEWNYLLNTRTNAATLRSFATVAGVKGLVILPDDWTASVGVMLSEEMTAKQWATIEETGAVFLPAAGRLSTVYHPENYGPTTTYSPGGFYWTSSPADASIANAMNFAGGVTFDDTQVAIGNLSRRTYNAVRLAKTIEMTVTTAASGFTTLVSIETLDFSNVEGLTAYIATNVDNGSDQVTLKSIGVVPANTPIVLKGAPNTKYRVSTTVTTATPPAGNLLRGSATKSVDLAAGAAYILSGGKFCKNAAGTMPAGKAYLPAAATTSNARALALYFDGDATAIQTLEVKEEPVRTGIYNLQGQRVKTPGKGLYIIDGKKVIIK